MPPIKLKQIAYCIQCGDPFKKNRSNQLFCSDSCREKLRNAKKRKRRQVKECIECGKRFDSINEKYPKLYCSSQCRNKHNSTAQIKDNKKHLPIRISRNLLCLRCGKPFKSYGKDNRLCDYCRQNGQYIEPYAVAL